MERGGVARAKPSINYLLRLKAICGFCGLKEINPDNFTCFNCNTTNPGTPIVKKGKPKNVPCKSDS